jgi:hypothetical protein
MRIKISLQHLLSKNKTDLRSFLRKNKLNSYDDVLVYCEGRNIIPVSREEYQSHTAVKKGPVKKEPEEKNEQKSRAKSVDKGSVSKTQKKPRSRSRSRKVKES